MVNIIIKEKTSVRLRKDYPKMNNENPLSWS